MRYATIKILLEKLEKFEQETGQADVEGFAAWLLQQSSTPNLPRFSTKWDPQLSDDNARLGMQVGILNQHAKHYIKTALKGLPLKGIFDYTFLATLLPGSLRKSELIQSALVEFSPGMEVIRRLLRHHLIEDFEDPADGRSRRVRITPAGEQAFQEASARFEVVNQIIAGNLTYEEKQLLLNLLSKLIHFHQPIWNEHWGEDLEQIREKYLPDQALSRDDQ